MNNMVKIIEGNFNINNKKVCIVVSRFNSFITDRLLEGALDCFYRHNIYEISVIKVPGAFEIPLMCKKASESKKFDCVVALGAVIRGETPHFDFVANEVSKGLASISLETGIPNIFGVLTTDTVEQAEVRSGAKGSNKGFEAALTAIEMMNLIENFNKLV